MNLEERDNRPLTKPTSRTVSVLCGVLVAGCVAFAGTRREVSPVTVGCVAAFLLCAVEADVRTFRIPNLVTFTALGAAIVFGTWSDGAYGFVQASLGAGAGLVLLLPLYALGGLGAGDVKAVMSLGAWLGPSAAAGVAIRGLLLAAIGALLWLAWRREVVSFARRWFATISSSLILRRFSYVAPPAGSAANSGLPFAAALGVGVAWQWYGGVAA